MFPISDGFRFRHNDFGSSINFADKALAFPSLSLTPFLSISICSSFNSPLAEPSNIFQVSFWFCYS